MKSKSTASNVLPSQPRNAASIERFGDEFNEGKIYRVRFTDLLEWILEIPNFHGTRAQSTEGHLEMIQSGWVYEWRDNQK